MKHLASLLFSLALILTSSSPHRGKTAQELYIEQFASLAVDEMYRSGIPASITLAQGLLESRYGLSELALKGNNHFGIKCHNDWQGGKVYHDDDRKGECFRKYDSPEESFRDHSDFLRYRDRYKFLFDLEVNDYKAWAYGLKKAGYATDPSYPSKLIKLIEDYALYEFDRPERQKEDWYLFKGVKKESSNDAGEKKVKARKEKAEKSAADKTPSRKQQKKASGNVLEQTLPESPSKIEEVKLLEDGPKAEFRFPLSRQMYSQNGVPFVYSSHGETYASIAKAFDLFYREILKFNDLPLGADVDQELLPGTVVYVQPKKNEAARGLDKHVIESGDNMRDLAQRYAVKLDRIYRMNGIDPTYSPREGDIIKLRK